MTTFFRRCWARPRVRAAVALLGTLYLLAPTFILLESLVSFFGLGV